MSLPTVGAGPSGSGFTNPTSLSNLELWVVANLAWQDSVGGTPADDDTEVVGAWEDQSGNGYHLTVASNKPILKVNIVNSQPVVRFNGTNNLLGNTGGLATAFTGEDKAITAFAVVKRSATGTFHPLLSWGKSGNATPIFEALGWGSSNAYLGVTRRDDASTFKSASGGASDANFHVFEVVDDGTTSNIYVDGTLTGSANQDTDVSTITLDDFKLGKRSQGANLLNGDVAEVVVYSVALSAGDRLLVRQYLADIYNITLS